MRKLKIMEHISLDGVIQISGGPSDGIKKGPLALAGPRVPWNLSTRQARVSLNES